MKSASASSFFCWRQERKTVQALPLEPEQLRSIEYMFTHNLAERKHEGTRSQKLRTRVSSRQVLRQLELIRFKDDMNMSFARPLFVTVLCSVTRC